MIYKIDESVYISFVFEKRGDKNKIVKEAATNIGYILQNKFVYKNEYYKKDGKKEIKDRK